MKGDAGQMTFLIFLASVALFEYLCRARKPVNEQRSSPIPIESLADAGMMPKETALSDLLALAEALQDRSAQSVDHQEIPTEVHTPVNNDPGSTG
jgi:hypothetical protein